MSKILFAFSDVDAVANLHEEENMCDADGVLKADTIDERTVMPNEHKIAAADIMVFELTIGRMWGYDQELIADEDAYYQRGRMLISPGLV